nr:probable multidrug resistance-associated protein lethal(2)03659 [Leptinotarsa decemlineata]
MGSSADTSIVFYLVTNFKELKRTIGVDLPRNIGRAAEMVSAASRINKVLSADESHCSSCFHVDNPIVELKRVTVHVGGLEILKDISFEVGAGLTIVTGKIGSGKSTLLNTILEKNLLSSGKVHIRGSISYASQDPWLFPSTIRQNILFGKKIDENRYRRVIQTCALQYDFDLLDKSDETILTDNGANLSKGQRTRINLARAIYNDSNIYLLDDSLSSLDSCVQDYVFNKCIKTFLKDKICILVSQNMAHVNKADTVIIMDEGKIKEIKRFNRKASQDEEVRYEEQNVKKIASDESIEDELDETALLIEIDDSRKNLIYREEKKEGKVLIDVYHKYVIFGGGYILLLMNLALGGLTQISGSFADKFLTMWVDDKQKILTLRNQFSNFSTENITINQTLVQAEAQENHTLRLYSILLFTATVLVLITTYVNFDFCRRASIKIHQVLVRSIMRTFPSFFDSCYIGNILNRFSEDLAQLDENFPFIFRELLEDMFSIIGQISLVLTVDKYFLGYISIAFIVLLMLGKVYIPSGRSLKRLEASTRSPMVGHLNACLEGLKTIRASKAEDILKNEFDRHQNLYTSALYTSICAMSAFTFFMDLASCVLIIVVVIHFLFIDTGASSGNVGLALTQASMLGSTIQYAIRKLSVLENSMTSVERILEYTEVPLEKCEGEVQNNWPVEGNVTFENVSLSYNKETILKDISFKTEPKQKLGVMGRTGAGKSSIISLLFRLYDYQGKICIDGVDIKKLPLKFLRENLAVIPHDPLIFSGTVRSNIDPYGEFVDIDLAGALEKVKMKDFVSKLDLKITSELNFSSGQKQLISLARVLLRKKKIIIMDEPLEYLDYETQVIVQNIINENFQDCTILMISHKVQPFLEFDEVMVLDGGGIIEFGEPAILQRDENGCFHKLVEQAKSLNHSDSSSGNK